MKAVAVEGAGDAPLVLERRGLSLAVTVCEDVWVPGGRGPRASCGRKPAGRRWGADPSGSCSLMGCSGLC